MYRARWTPARVPHVRRPDVHYRLHYRLRPAADDATTGPQNQVAQALKCVGLCQQPGAVCGDGGNNGWRSTATHGASQLARLRGLAKHCPSERSMTTNFTSAIGVARLLAPSMPVITADY